MLCDKTLVNVVTSDAVPKTVGGSDEYIGLLLKNIFSSSKEN